MPGGKGEELLAVFRRLYEHYGPQGWWPGDTPFEVAIGAILTQAAAWRNVERALANLKEAVGALSPQALYTLPREELARLLRPVGYFNAKARKLRAFLEALQEGYGGELPRLLSLPLPELRERLLSIHGIGPETADAIILYAAQKPIFVVDAYTRRLFRRLGLGPATDSYGAWQSFFMEHLPLDVDLFNEYHALIVRHAKAACRKNPLCQGCCLEGLCLHRQGPR